MGLPVLRALDTLTISLQNEFMHQRKLLPIDKLDHLRNSLLGEARETILVNVDATLVTRVPKAKEFEELTQVC